MSKSHQNEKSQLNKYGSMPNQNNTDKSRKKTHLFFLIYVQISATFWALNFISQLFDIIVYTNFDFGPFFSEKLYILLIHGNIR